METKLRYWLYTLFSYGCSLPPPIRLLWRRELLNYFQRVKTWFGQRIFLSRPFKKIHHQESPRWYSGLRVWPQWLLMADIQLGCLVTHLMEGCPCLPERQMFWLAFVLFLKSRSESHGRYGRFPKRYRHYRTVINTFPSSFLF